MILFTCGAGVFGHSIAYGHQGSAWPLPSADMREAFCLSTDTTIRNAKDSLGAMKDTARSNKVAATRTSHPVSKGVNPPATTAGNLELSINCSVSGIYPVEGWNEMRDNLKEILEEENGFQKSKWKIDISFSRKGLPQDAKMLQSTSEYLNNLVLDFFYHEGRWQNTGQKRVQILVDIK